ncbi:hypothetical protein T484DRAFT_1912267 [Baffinella frigidus]|nr:hypothetical protein T484DRAFT_1912267 [Cryptophyta sp. CCMP2293]
MDLEECGTCGRKFNPTSMLKHAKVCAKVFQTKRKVMDSSKMRSEGTDNAKFLQVMDSSKMRSEGTNNAKFLLESQLREKKEKAAAARRGVRPSPAGNEEVALTKKANWKAKSEEFRTAMRNSRKITEAQAKGVDIRSLKLEDGPAEADERVPCPHCGTR